jgi:hypothetical protein
MSSGEQCRECGAVIPEGGPPGFCSRCLLKLGLEHGHSTPENPGYGVPEGVLPEAPPVGGTVESASEDPRNMGCVPTQFARAIEQPGDKIGRYKLLQKIGEGGCGVV